MAACEPDDILNSNLFFILVKIVFADFDMDGHLEALVPACEDGPTCRLPKLLMAKVTDMFQAGDDFDFETLDFDHESLGFDFGSTDDKHPYG